MKANVPWEYRSALRAEVVQGVEARQFECVTREDQSVVNKETTNRTHDLSVVNKRSPTDLMTW
jgi:hypothetical protein